MTGQVIILPGVVAAASLGAPRIDMNASDVVAARIASLKHVVSPRSLVTLPGGGVSGRCRATGLALVPKGTVTALQLSDVAGKRALGLSAITSAGLGLPPGSRTASYTTVVAVTISQADIDSTTLSASPRFIGGYDAAGTHNLTVLQYYGAAGNPPNIFTANGSGDSSSPFAKAARPNGTWVIAVVDFNNDTKTVSLSLNQADTFATLAKAEPHAPGATDYLEIGSHHVVASGLRTSRVGDLYTFSNSLLATDPGRQQLKDLVAALKTEYGI